MSTYRQNQVLANQTTFVLVAAVMAASSTLPVSAATSVKKWQGGTQWNTWHVDSNWDSDNPLDGGVPDSDDVAVFDTAGNIWVLFDTSYDAAYCNVLDVRRGDVILNGQGLPLVFIPHTFNPTLLEVDTATLALEDTEVTVGDVTLAPKAWDNATLEVRADAQILGNPDAALLAPTLNVGDEGVGVLILRTPTTSFDGAPGSAMVESFSFTRIGGGGGGRGTLNMDSGSTLRTTQLQVAAGTNSTGSLVVHENAILQAPYQIVGYRGAASVLLMGKLDGQDQFFAAGTHPSQWATEPGASALVTIDGGRYVEDDAIEIGRAIVQIQDGGQLIAEDISLAKNGNGYVELYSSGNGELTARGRLVVGQDGYTLLNATSGTHIESQIGVVADAADSVAEVTLSGANTRWLSSGDTGEMNIGWYGSATVDVIDGAILENEWGFIARGSGAGTTRIAGSGSSWINHGNLSVGNGGGSSGSMTVASGASVECAYAQVGRFAGSSGFVDVRDSGSTWTVRKELLVGGTGQGSLQISNGGRVDGIERAMIGANPESTGLAVVSGIDSTWHTGAALHVGSGSAGRLRVVDGGTVENNWAFLGVDNGVSGEATVSGSSSRWISNSNMAIGHHGFGSVLIQSGGYVEGQDLLIGRYFDGVGEVSAADAGSTLISRGHLHVGLDGQGWLDLAGGAQVESGLDVMVASGTGSTGRAAVTGAGSTFRVGRSLYIGGKAGAQGGNGTVTVTQGGTISVADTLKLWPEGSLELIQGGSITTSHFDLTDGGSFSFNDGMLTVSNGTYSRPAFGEACNETIDGTDPRIVLSDSSLDLGACTLMVGNHHNGALTINGTHAEGGALVRSGVVFLAEHTGSSGRVELYGESAVIETDVLRVAYGGTGELSIGSASRVQIGSLMDIGSAPMGSGTVWVQGSLDTDTLIVGNEGTGVLQIQTGGSLRSNAALVARRAGSTGSVLIADGGAWMVNGSCYVGDFSDGTSGGTGDIRVGQNRPVGPATFAVAEELVVGSPDSAVTVQNGNLTAASIVLDAGARLTMYGGSVRTASVLLASGSLGLYGGTLTTPLVVGDLFTQGTVLSPGEPIGTLHVDGSFGQGGRGGPFPAGSSRLELRGRSGEVEHDSITVNGPATLGGDLHLRAIADFVPSPDDTFVLLRAATLEGTFWNAVPEMYVRVEGSPVECRVDYGPTSPFDANDVVLSECRGTGDADGNGRTNLEDFAGMPDCLTGPGEAISDSCFVYDLDLNAVVDLRDFGRMQIIGIDTRR